MKYYYTSSLNAGAGFTFENDTHMAEDVADVIVWIEGKNCTMMSCTELTQEEYFKIRDSRKGGK